MEGSRPRWFYTCASRNGCVSFSLGLRQRDNEGWGVRPAALTLRNGNGKRESGRGVGGFASSALPRFVVY